MNPAPATPPLFTPSLLIPAWQPGQLEDNTLGQGPDIWLLPLGQLTPEPGLLSPAERARADGLATAEARRAMLALRTAQRRILASYLNTAADRLVFATATKGKPALTGQGVRFNLSHSQGQAVLAVSRSEVGIDLEWPRPLPRLAAIAKRLFDAETIRSLHHLQGPQQLAAFTRAWVCLEARQKLSGEGLFGQRLTIEHQLWLYQLDDGGLLALAQAGAQSPKPRLWHL